MKKEILRQIDRAIDVFYSQEAHAGKQLVIELTFQEARVLMEGIGFTAALYGSVKCLLEGVTDELRYRGAIIRAQLPKEKVVLLLSDFAPAACMSQPGLTGKNI